MKALISIVIIVTLGWLGMKFSAYYRDVQARSNPDRQEEPLPADYIPPGMPDTMEPSLAQAKGQGTEALKRWLDRYRAYVQEPRRSEIELDYVVMLGRTDPPAAKRIFQAIQAKNGPDSPLAGRIDKLAKTYR